MHSRDARAHAGSRKITPENGLGTWNGWPSEDEQVTDRQREQRFEAQNIFQLIKTRFLLDARVVDVPLAGSSALEAYWEVMAKECAEMKCWRSR